MSIETFNPTKEIEHSQDETPETLEENKQEQIETVKAQGERYNNELKMLEEERDELVNKSNKTIEDKKKLREINSEILGLREKSKDFQGESDQTSGENKQLQIENKEENEKKEISNEVLERFNKEFNIDNDDLEKIDGFNELSKGQQFLVAENLKQLTLGRIQEEATIEHKKDITESKILGRIWKNISKKYQIAKLEKNKEEEISKGGYEIHNKTLQQLVNGMKESGVDAEIKDGKLEIQYASDFKNLTPEKQKQVDEFNQIATEFSKIPYEWSLETAKKKEQRQYKKLKEKYDDTKKNILVLKAEELKIEKDAVLYMNDVEMKIKLNQFLNSNPDVEKQLQNIKDKKVWLRALANIITERGIYAGAGFITRTATISLVGLAGAPLAAAGMGGFLARKRAKETLKEKNILARKGEEDNSKEAKDFVDAEYIHESIDFLVSELENDLLDDEKKEEIIRSLNFHIEDARNKIEDGTVNFGNQKDRLFNQQKLIKKISEGAVIAEYNGVNNKKYIKDIEVISEFLKKQDKTISKAKKKYLRDQIIKGAVISAGFATAGYTIRHFGQELGWIGGSEDDIVTKQDFELSEADKEVMENLEKLSEEDKKYIAKNGLSAYMTQKQFDDTLNPINKMDTEVDQVVIIDKDKSIDDIAKNIEQNEVVNKENIIQRQKDELDIQNIEFKEPLSKENLEILKNIKDKNLVESILKDGEVNPQEIGIINNDKLPYEIKAELLKSKNQEKYLELLNKINTDKFSKLSDEQKVNILNYIKSNKDSNLQELVGKVNSAELEIVQGDNLTKIARKILNDKNTSLKVKDAFIEKYYPKHVEIIDGNRSELLKTAINKISISNIEMKDGNDLQNLIYKGNEVHINSETGEIYVKQGNSSLKAKAVSESQLRENWADQRAEKLGLNQEQTNFTNTDDLSSREISTNIEIDDESYEAVIDLDNNYSVKIGEEEINGSFDNVNEIEERVSGIKEIQKIEDYTITDADKINKQLINMNLNSDVIKNMINSEIDQQYISKALDLAQEIETSPNKEIFLDAFKRMPNDIGGKEVAYMQMMGCNDNKIIAKGISEYFEIPINSINTNIDPNQGSLEIPLKGKNDGDVILINTIENKVGLRRKGWFNDIGLSWGNNPNKSITDEGTINKIREVIGGKEEVKEVPLNKATAVNVPDGIKETKEVP